MAETCAGRPWGTGGVVATFPILHPCFFTPQLGRVRAADDRRIAREIGHCVRADPRGDRGARSAVPEALRGSAPPFRVPFLHRTLLEWLKLAAAAGFVIERAGEPWPSKEVARVQAVIAGDRIVPGFRHLRARQR